MKIGARGISFYFISVLLYAFLLTFYAVCSD